jgi:hypothetical protein
MQHAMLPAGYIVRLDLKIQKLITRPFVSPALPVFQFGRLSTNSIVRRHALRNKHIAADHAAVPNNRVATENGRPCINGDMFFDGRMPLLPPQRLPKIRCQRAQRDALIHLHKIADFRGLSDHHARPMVDEKTSAEFCTGMDINTCQAMRMLRHDARQQRHIHVVKLMRQPLHADRVKSGIAKHSFIGAVRSGIAIECRLYIFRQERSHHRDLIEELRDHLSGLQIAVDARLAAVIIAGNLLPISQAMPDLVVQLIRQLAHQLANAIGDVAGVEALMAKISGKENLPQQADAMHDLIAAGQMHAIQMPRARIVHDAVNQRIHDLRQAIIEFTAIHKDMLAIPELIGHFGLNPNVQIPNPN